MKRVLVTGKNGQVVSAMIERAGSWPQFDLVLVGRPECDFAGDHDIASHIASLEPDIVVNAAAYTAVDQAEDEPELAMVVNGDAPGEVARGAAMSGAPIVQLSTDYVFSGLGETPWRETDQVGPVTAYGSSKLAGEEAVMAANPRHVILRTAWVYGPTGKNFLRTMLALATTRDEISTVNDQHGNPTTANDIAEGIFHVIEKISRAPEEGGNYGVFHMAGSQVATWYEFAGEIFRQSHSLGGNFARVVPVGSSVFPSKAKRPLNSRLSSGKFIENFGYTPSNYKTGIANTLSVLLKNG